MSIIIRLQNLPLSAKSGDIRHFFGGLRIPNGGVHIVGGEKGDAFIAFESDEDARLAMRKDGGKLMGSRIKLYLSSFMEMQHEIKRITKDDPDVSDRLSPHERLRRRSPPRVRERSVDSLKHYRSDSPMRSRSAYHTGRGLSPHPRRSSRLRSGSPGFRSRSPRMRSRSPRQKSRSPRIRSRSPRRRSKSPYIYSSKRSRSPLSRRSISPLSRSVSLRRSRSVSPYRNDFARYKPSFYESENGDRNSYRDERISRHSEYYKREGTSREGENIYDWIHKDLSLKEEQLGKNLEDPRTQLEKRITEVLKTGFDSIKKIDPYSNIPNTADIPYSGPSLNSYINPAPERGLLDNIPAYSIPNINISKDISVASSFPPPNINYINSQNMSLSNQQFQNPPPPIVSMTSVPPPPLPLTALPPMNVPPPIQMPAIPPPVPVPNIPPPAPMPAIPPPLSGAPVDVAMPPSGFYITISGLDPNWNFNEVQEMLKGTFVPLNNIKWEIDDHGLKTGTAFIKLSIREDFNHFLHHATYVYSNRLITVSECPSHVVHRYFLPEWPPKGPVDTSQNSNLYYRLKGLPYTVTYDDIIQFFQGLDIADIYIERENEVATGIGYVGFNNTEDYQEAFKLNGKNIGRRFIHMMVSSKRSMLRLKKKRGDLLSQSRVLIPSTVSPSDPAPDISPSSQRRPLCTLLTGLPQDITPSRIKKFFKNSGPSPIPDAIHVTLNDKGRPNCRAYAEFNSVRDFDAALKFHGTSLDGKIICVKQILFDEMVKILNTQRAMHYFEKPTPNLPEKSFHMWQQDVNQGPPMDFSPADDHYRRMPIGPEAPPNRPEVQVFEYGNQSREPMAVQGNMLYEQDDSFDLQHRQHKDTSQFKSEKWPLSNSALDRRGRADSFSSPKFIVSDNFVRDQFATKVEDFESNRDPVKFEVKTKQPMSKKSELSDAFDRSLKPEFKKKLTKLSPERPLVQDSKPSSTKSEKNGKEKKSESSSKVSLDKNIHKKDGRKSPDCFVSSRARNESNAGKSSKSESKYKSRGFERRQDDYSFKNYPRSPSPGKVRYRGRRSRSLSPYSHDRYSRSDSYFDEREAVVQISNVDPIIEGPELADFLHGFDVNHDKIIRRIDRGKPAWDIRVTFRNDREAERAIRILNGSYLNGVPVDMFFVD